MYTPPVAQHKPTEEQHVRKTTPLRKRKISFDEDMNSEDINSRDTVETSDQRDAVEDCRNDVAEQQKLNASCEKVRTKRFRADQTLQWDRRYEELREYKLLHGDCLVPRTYTPNPQLGTWVNTQRKQYRLLKLGKQSQMTPSRVIALEGLGFVWSKCEKPDWESRLEDLRRYKQEYGNCLVPQRFSKNPQLGTWVNNQRTQYRLYKQGQSSPMTAERVLTLEKVGFVWFVTPNQKPSSVPAAEVKQE